MHCESQDFLAEGLLLEPRNFRISVHHRIERSKLLNWPLDDLQRRPLLSRCWWASAIKRVTGRNHHFMGTRPSKLEQHLARTIFGHHKFDANVSTRNRKESPTVLAATLKIGDTAPQQIQFPIKDQSYFTYCRCGPRLECYRDNRPQMISRRKRRTDPVTLCCRGNCSNIGLGCPASGPRHERYFR
jgi:hypothetical protein